MIASSFQTIAARLLFALTVGLAPIMAMAADPMYTAEVRVKSQSPQDTLNGTARALLIVLERVSGDPGVKSRPYLGLELKNARDLVKSSDFVQKEGLNAAGIPSFGTNIVVEFYPDRVRELAKKVGLQYWPEPRPSPLAWLVVDDGQSGPRLVSYRERSAAHALLDRGLFRGVQIVLPKGNAAEKLLVGAILRKDLRAVSAASAAYQGNTQLIGTMRRSGQGWQADWTFINRGQVLKSWTTTESDPFVTMADGANGAADALIRRYAIAGRPPQPPPLTPEELAALEAEKAAAAEQAAADAAAAAANATSIVRESFTGVNSNADYGNLIGRLNQIPGVKSVSTVATTPGGISVDIVYQGDAASLRAAIALAGLRSSGSKTLQDRPQPPAPAPVIPTTTPPAATPAVKPADGKTPAAPAKPADAKAAPPATKDSQVF